MYNYKLNQEMDDVKAIYYDGTVFGVNRIKDYIANTDAKDYIDDVWIVPDSETSDGKNWSSSIKGCVVELIAKTGANIDSPLHDYQLLPGDVLLTKVGKDASGNDCLVLATIPMSAFSVIYKCIKT